MALKAFLNKEVLELQDSALRQEVSSCLEGILQDSHWQKEPTFYFRDWQHDRLQQGSLGPVDDAAFAIIRQVVLGMISGRFGGSSKAD